MNHGDYAMQLATIKGVDYQIEATKDTFTTAQLSGEQSGEVRVMMFDRTDMTWKYSDSNVFEHPVTTFLGDRAESVRLYTDNSTLEVATADLADRVAMMAHPGACGFEAVASTR